jgi:hypothetical protein
MGALATGLQLSGSNDEKAGEDMQLNNLNNPPFFRLPGELRNRIYEYALTTDKTLRFIDGRRGEGSMLLEPNSRHAHGEHNQIKYACHQLYQETAGLEAKFNKVEILRRRSPDAGTARIFRSFLARTTHKKGAWYADVTMKSLHCGHNNNELLEPASDLLPIADFCRRIPHVNICYIPGGFGYTTYIIHHFAAAGLFINRTVRQCDIFPGDLSYNLMKAAADR